MEGSASGDAGQGRGALPAGKHPAVRGGFFRESPFLPVPVCQMDALAKKESDIPLPVIQSKNPGIKVVWMAMAGKDQQGPPWPQSRELPLAPIKQQCC